VLFCLLFLLIVLIQNIQTLFQVVIKMGRPSKYGSEEERKKADARRKAELELSFLSQFVGMDSFMLLSQELGNNLM